MPEQLGLRYNDGYRFDEVWAELLDELRVIVATIGLKQVAYDLDVQPSALSHALAERDRHYVRADWLPYLVAKAPGDHVVELLASLRGLEVQPVRELTPAEKLERIEKVLDANPDMGAVVRMKAGLSR